MTIIQLIMRARHLDITMQLVGDKIDLDAPDGVLSDDLMNALKESKPKLKVYLWAEKKGIELHGLEMLDVIREMNETDWQQAIKTPHIIQDYAHLTAHTKAIMNSQPFHA